MKIAVLAASAHPGGAERVTVNLVNEFARRGHAVDLLLANAAGEMLSEVAPKVRVIGLGVARARAAIRPFRRYLMRDKPDAVIAITYEMNLTAALAAASVRPRPRLILSVHGPIARMKEAKRLWSWGAWALSRIAYRVADQVVAVSDGVAEDLLRAGWATKRQLRKIYNPVVSPNFEKLAAEQLPRGLKRPARLPLIITVGRLSPEKNQRLLLKAFARLTEQRAAHLWIVGEGPERARLEAEIARLNLRKTVTLIGHVANPLPLVKAADLFVLTSNREGFGNVLVEALAVGTPIVATDCPHGPRDILAGGRWGTLVRPGDPEALAEAMGQALDGKVPKPGKRARDFTVEAAGDAYLALI